MPFIPVKKKREVPRETKPRHVHLMYLTPAGSWKCADGVCKKVGRPNGGGIASSTGNHVVVFGKVEE